MERKPQKEGIYVYIWLIHFAEQQKRTQHCETTILQQKFNLQNKIYPFKKRDGEEMRLQEDQSQRGHLSFRIFSRCIFTIASSSEAKQRGKAAVPGRLGGGEARGCWGTRKARALLRFSDFLRDQ